MQLQLHILRQSPARQQQPFARSVADLLLVASIDPHALGGVEYFQQGGQPGSGAVGACHGHALAGCQRWPAPRLTVGTIAIADAQQAALQRDGVRDIDGGGERGFQRLRKLGGQAFDGVAKRGGQIGIVRGGHVGILGCNRGATGRGWRAMRGFQDRESMSRRAQGPHAPPAIRQQTDCQPAPPARGDAG